MVALKSELWINRVLTLLMIGSVLWIGITGFKRDDSQIDQDEMDTKATKTELKTAKTDLTKQIETGDASVRNEAQIWQQSHDDRHDDLMVVVSEIRTDVREIKNRK